MEDEMALFELTMDGMGFTDDSNMTDFSMSEDEAVVLTSKLKAAQKLPPGVLEVVRASVSEDDEQGESDIKVFASVVLLVEADSESAAEAMTIPDDFLLEVVTEMVSEDADSAYGLTGTFEVLSCDPVEATTV